MIVILAIVAIPIVVVVLAVFTGRIDRQCWPDPDIKEETK